MDAFFHNRRDAGRKLATRLHRYAGREDVIVLALPRGGVPVGFEIARALGLHLDVFLVRKLGVPGHEEFAMGAIASGGVKVLNHDVVHNLQNAEAVIAAALQRERKELRRREKEYRDGRSAADLAGKVVILVDDGLATGSTMRAAMLALRKSRIASLVVAVPVGAPDTCAELRAEADEVICLCAPEDFYAVGQFYEDFSQTSDEEVREMLAFAATLEVNS